MFYNWNIVNELCDPLKDHLITYIGNKRKLIPQIDELINQIKQNDNTVNTFLDMFSGSGVVSRYAKLKGFTVISNDLEKYTIPFNFTYIKSNMDDINQYFNGKYEEVLDQLNSLETPNNKYFSLHYSPQNTNNPKINEERMFYTQENALRIDAILENIHSNFNEDQKMILLANLLHKMSVHNNTSGIMISYHAGFGGSTKTALSRIMKPIKLDIQPFFNGIRGQYFNDYAEELFEKYSLPEQDIVYIDPPYTNHQYSAYYHLLNTAFLNDKYNPGNISKRKSGIREDYNKSKFCYKNTCQETFKKLLSSIKAKYVIFSYNDEGTIQINDFINIISMYFKFVEKKQISYTKYQGKFRTTQFESNDETNEYLIYASNHKSLDI